MRDTGRESRQLPPARQRSFEKISALSFNENRTEAVAWDGSPVDLSSQRTVRKCSANGGLGVTVYVIDTGCRSSHEQLRGRVRTLVAPGSRYRSGEDDHGHGTHVAATIGGRDFGIAPQVKLVCIKALSERNEGSAHDVVAGVQLAIRMHRGQRGPGIISISLGGRAVKRYTVLDAAVNTASKAGLSFVVAAGNAGANACSFTPGRARKAITVAAVDGKGNIAGFSNSGACVSVGAPGVRVWSAVADEDDAYGVSSGTSMAAPFVSGLVALLVGDRGKTRASTLRRWLKSMGKKGHDAIETEPNDDGVLKTAIYDTRRDYEKQ
ncbi:Alkaline serine exoprotease A precursor [Gracilaria domingensis]|nr:Alkaline serine exoprotease A precursor [Gracilaria domingensis]